MNSYEKAVEAVDAMLQIDQGKITIDDYFNMNPRQVITLFSKDRGTNKGAQYFHYLGLDVSEMDNFLRKNGVLSQEEVKANLRNHPHGALRMLIDNLTETIIHDEGLGLFIGYYEKALQDANI